MRILLVEDEILIAMEQRFYLETAGDEVFGPAATTTEAVEMALAIKPDLALVDIHLAQGSSGIDVADSLGALGIPSLFITSFRDEVKPGRSFAIGCLPKPFTERSLLGAVEVARAVLSGRPPARVPEAMELFQPPPLSPEGAPPSV